MAPRDRRLASVLRLVLLGGELGAAAASEAVRCLIRSAQSEKSWTGYPILFTTKLSPSLPGWRLNTNAGEKHWKRYPSPNRAGTESGACPLASLVRFFRGKTK